MESKIKKEAKKLYEKALKRYYGRPKGDNRSLSVMLDEELKRYNEAVRPLIENAVYERLNKSFATESLPDIVPSKATLSRLLYRNAKRVAAYVRELFKRHIASKPTIQKLSRLFYEGYGFRDKEVLDVNKELPHYLKTYLQKPHTQRAIERQISRLKTKPLRAAYKGIVEAMETHNDKALKRALKVALEEKARYYATRIAQTEQQRSINLARAKEYIDDKEIAFVKYRMSSKHPMMDICDYYANLDVGYGKGIVPKAQMVTLPLHPHCMCRYDPYYLPVKRKKPTPWLEKQSESVQRQVLGGYAQWKKWKEGAPIESVFNMTRPKYPIKRYMDILSPQKSDSGSIVMTIKEMLRQLREKERLIKDRIVVGYLDDEIVKFLEERGVPIHTKEIYLTHKGLSHLARDTKRKRGAGLNDSDILSIPKVINRGNARFDEKGGKNVLFFQKSSEKYIKLVVDTSVHDKKLGKITLIKTAGYVVESNLNQYEKIE